MLTFVGTQSSSRNGGSCCCCRWAVLHFYTFIHLSSVRINCSTEETGVFRQLRYETFKMHCLISEWASRLANWLLAEPLWKLSLLCIMHIFCNIRINYICFCTVYWASPDRVFFHVQKHFFPVKMFAGCMNGAESRQSCKLCAHLPVYGTVLAPGVSDSRWLVYSGYLLLNLVLASTTRTTKTFGDVVLKRQ